MRDYSKIEKLLHRQFLRDNVLTDYLYQKIEKNSKIKKEINFEKIFIIGIARSGTTALLNALYDSGNFASLLYKHMPFILSPKLANFFSNISKSYKSEERYHKDKIFINGDSPESLEEPFWLKACKKSYKKNFVKQINVPKKLIEKYEFLLNEYCVSQNKAKIIIKNNNNIIRFDSLCSHINNAKFLILFRDPIQTAISMLNQHLNFLELQKRDPFIEEYMNLIGHFEFGNNIKTFKFKSMVYLQNKKFNSLDLNFWIIQWINAYNFLLKNYYQFDKDKIIFISYEILCNKKEFYKSLCRRLKLSGDKLNYNFIEKKSNINLYKDINPNLLKESYSIYNELKKKVNLF